jgi:hypothetical protein
MDCERVVWARCGKACLKLSSSSSFGFCELVLQRSQVRYKARTRVRSASRSAGEQRTRNWGTHRFRNIAGKLEADVLRVNFQHRERLRSEDGEAPSSKST